MKTPALFCSGLAIASILSASIAFAVDVPIPLRLYLNRAASKTKFVARGSFILPDATSDSPVDSGGAITFSSGATSEMLVLPAANWRALGNPPGAHGFTYTDPSGNSCRKLRITPRSIKGLCRATSAGAPPYDPGVDASISIVLSVGASPQHYCAECPNGGEQRGNPQKITKFKDCLAPAACPGQPLPTPTATPSSEGVCCQVSIFCGSAPSAIACLETVGGTAVGGGAVCDASGACVPPPGVPGGCCESTVIYPLCSIVDQASCDANGGTFHALAVCAPTGVCVE